MTNIDNEPIVMSVSEYFDAGINPEVYPITIEVRDQLAELLRATPGPQIDALFKAIMTTVMNLELTALERQTELIRLRTNTIDVWRQLVRLKTELVQNGVVAPTSLPEIDWFGEEDE